MDPSHVTTTLELLSSTKAKERNDALQELVTILKHNPDIIPTKLLASTIEHLIEVLDGERSKYCKLISQAGESAQNRVSITENRLSTISYVVRLLVEKTCERYKTKHIRLLITLLPELMLQEGGQQPLDPVAQHLLYAILFLVQSESFSLKVELHQWIGLTGTMCRYLRHHLNILPNGKSISILIMILLELISKDTIGIEDVCDDLANAAVQYLEIIKKETVNTKNMLQLVNKIILKTHLLKVANCFVLVETTMVHITTIGSFTNEAIEYELSIFNIFLSELMYNKLPLIIGDANSRRISSSEQLLHAYEEYAALQLDAYNPSKLSLNSFEFRMLDKRIEWLEFNDFQLNKDSEVGVWVQLLGVTKLLFAYYELRESCENGNTLLFKKKKTSDCVGKILKDSFTPVSFITNCVTSSSFKVRLAGLHFCGFYTALYDIGKNDISILFASVFQTFEDVPLIGWSCLAIIPILSQDRAQLTREEFVHVFKLCLPHIKSPSLCKVACTLVYRLIKFQFSNISDKTLLHQINDVYELSEINGPSLVINETFLFWQYLHLYGKGYKSRTQDSSTTRVIAWLLSKWDQITGLKATQDGFYKFIAWLGNRHESRSQDCVYTTFANFNESCYSEWELFSNERHFLLGVDIPKKVARKKSSKVPDVIVEKAMLYEVFYRILHLIEHTNADAIHSFKWTCESLRIIDHYVGESSFLDYVNDFKTTVALTLPNVDFCNEDILLLAFKEVNSLNVKHVSHILLSELKLEAMMNNFKCQVLENKQSSRDSNVDDFSNSRKERQKCFRLPEFPYLYDHYNRTEIQDASIFLIKVSNVLYRDDQSKVLEIFLEFISGFSTELLVQTLGPLISYLNSIKTDEIPLVLLEQLTELLASALLNAHYNSSNHSMTYLSLYLDAIRSSWLNPQNDSLSTDCNDVLDWITSKYDENAFSGREALASLSKLMIRMLKNHDLSHGSVKGGKQRIFGIYISCLKKLPNFVVADIINEVKDYMLKVGSKNQAILFAEIVSIFDTPHESIEKSAFYTLVMFNIGSISHTQMVGCIINMLPYALFPHVESFIQCVLERFTIDYKLANLKELFHLCRFSILDFWFTESAGVQILLPEIWKVSLFGFDTFLEFTEEYSVELAGFYFSKSSKFPYMMNFLKENTSKNESELLEESLHLVFPLSYISGGIMDKLFDDCRHFLGKKFDGIVRSTSLLIFYWLLRFSDLSNAAEINATFTKLYPRSLLLKTLFNESSSETKCQLPLRISLPIALKLFRKHIINDAWDERTLRFLLMKSMADIEYCTNPEEIVHTLRRIRCMLILFEDSVPQCEYIVDLGKQMTKYLQDQRLHDEVSVIIVAILEFNHLLYFRIDGILPAVLAHLLSIKGTINAKTGIALKRVLTSTISNKKLELKYSKTWSHCIDVLNGQSLDSTVYCSDELLKDEPPDLTHFLLLSELFRHHAKPVPFDLQFNSSEVVARRLIKISIPADMLSANFHSWRGYYLGFFYMQHGYVPKTDNDLSETVNPTKAFFNYGTLEGVLESVYYTMNKSESSPAKFLCDCIIGVLLFRYPKEKKSLSFHPDDYEKFLKYILPIDFGLFTHFHSIRPSDQTLTEFLLTEYKLETISYNKWIFSLFSSLAQELAPYASSMPLFSKLAQEIPSFSESAVIHMFLFLMHCDSRQGIQIVTEIILGLTSLINDAVCEYGRKAALVLKLFFIVRSGVRLGIKEFDRIYCALDLHDIYRSAIKINCMKSAYMILEETFLESKHVPDASSLAVIFNELQDKDLLYGLPIEPSFYSAIELVNKTAPRSWKSFMFNNSKFDVAYSTSRDPDTLQLIRSINLNGFSGVASLLNESVSSGAETDEMYRWNVKLEKWDLPPPDNLDTRDKSVYSILKQIRAAPSNVQGILQDALPRVVKSDSLFKDKDTWVGLLSSITGLERILTFTGNPTLMGKHLEHLLIMDNNILKKKDFQDYESSMSIRHTFLNQLIQGNHDTSRLPILQYSEIIELTKYGNFARQNACFQESLNAVMLLDRKLENLYNGDERLSALKFITKRLSIVEAARVLRSQGENNTSVSMLKALLKEHVDSQLTVLPDYQNFYNLLNFHDIKIKSLLVKWVSQSRLETPKSIFYNYIASSEMEMGNIKEHKERAIIYNTFGEFCYTQTKKFNSNTEMEERLKRYDRTAKELGALYEIYKDPKVPERERKEAKRHYNKLKLQMEQDKEILDNILKQKHLFVWKSLHFFLSTLVYSNDMDGDVLDKFCGLWFEYSDNEEINIRLKQDISSIPSFKFLPWINQITSRLYTENTTFQKTLQLTLKRVLYKLPYESLYSVISMKLHKKYDSSNDPSITARVSAVEKIFKELETFENGRFVTDFINPILEFCENCVELACTKKFNQRSRNLELKNLTIGDYWLNRLKLAGIPLPTVPFKITCSGDGRAGRPTIVGIVGTVEISSSGLSLPKIVTFQLSDGSRHKVLMKGSNDDLRQDAIMEQVFKQVNKILMRNKETRKRGLRIRTYEVIPLGPQAGLLEFVANSIPLHDILCTLHKNDEMSFDQARKAMRAVQTKSNEERLRAYSKIADMIQPQFRNFFFSSFLNPEDWLNARTTYIKGVVTSSIVGYVLGLGDRHLNNILIDRATGEPIHIDLGVAFDQGRLLPIPELVPFRLTRDMVDGFGVSGVEGLFRKNCEHVYGVLRNEYEKVICVLNVLKWDPLYSWVVSPLRKRKLQINLSDDSPDGTSGEEMVQRDEEENGNDQSFRALKGVQDKLIDNGLSVEATVQELIQSATDESKLAVIYMGWTPFY